jgi:hypothetical protein
MKPAPVRDLPDWFTIDQNGRKDFAEFKKVPDFEQILVNHAKNRKKVHIQAKYVYLPEQAGQFRAAVQAGLQHLPTAPLFDPPRGVAKPTTQTPAEEDTPMPQQSTAPDPPSDPPGGGGGATAEPTGGDTPRRRLRRLDPDQAASSDDPMDGGGPPPSAGAAQTLTVQDDRTAALERMVGDLRADLQVSDGARERARQINLQDQMAMVRIRSEEQARRTAFIEQTMEGYRQQPRAVPVTNTYQPTFVNNIHNLVQPITNVINNVQHNFNHQDVYNAHHTTMNYIQNNATRAINLAVNMG